MVLECKPEWNREAILVSSRLPSLMAADKPCPQLQPSLFKGRCAKSNSAVHFKKFHTDRPVESKVQCPRCPEEMAKSSLNSHMDQKHQLENFNQIDGAKSNIAQFFSSLGSIFER